MEQKTAPPEYPDTGSMEHVAENGMRQRPGFISANLHISHDKRHVANYAQWRSQADLHAMMRDPTAQVHMREAVGIADSFEPIYYELRESHTADAKE